MQKLNIELGRSSHPIEDYFTDYSTLNPNDHHPKIGMGVIVEIGFGTHPIFCYSWEVIRKIREGVLYIGIDQNPFQYPLKDEHAKKCLSGTWIQGNMEAIPLPENTVDEVWLMNVFGGMDEPKVCHSLYKNPDGRITTPAQQYFSELARILKPQGKIIIVEHLTPGYAYWLRCFNYPGFGLVKEDFSMCYGVERYWEFIQKHGLTKQINKSDPLLITLTKTIPIPP